MAVLDINMPQLTGLQVLGAIEREELATRVILLSGSATNEQIATADWEWLYGSRRTGHPGDRRANRT